MVLRNSEAGWLGEGNQGLLCRATEHVNLRISTGPMIPNERQALTSPLGSYPRQAERYLRMQSSAQKSVYLPRALR